MVGGGQLARMCWQAAIGLDLDLRVLAARADDAAARVLPAPVIGDADNAEALRRFAKDCDVVTLDHELVDLDTLAALEADGHVVRPGSAALRFAQDKAYQRRTLHAAGLPVPPFAVVDDLDGAAAFGAEHGWPIVLKLPRGGYDGRGVWHVPDRGALVTAWAEASAGGGWLLVEQAVPIDREVAVLLARRPGGQRETAPLIETVQADAMLRELVVPAPVPPGVADAAIALADRVVDLIGVVGVCAIELFWTGESLLVNELATRPHNSGHWTIDGAATSQFENHLRAVVDLPLGSMRATHPAVCSVNVVGTATAVPRAQLPVALSDPDVHVHLYGKSPRPGRKLGHVTATAADATTARERAHRAAHALMRTR